MYKYKIFTMALDLLIDMNRRERKEQDLLNLPTALVNRELKTVRVSAGRNVGKTTYIESRAQETKDIVLFPTQLQKSIFLERLEQRDCSFSGAFSINHFFRLCISKRISPPKTIWVDNFSMIKGQDLDDLMNFLDSIHLDDDGIIVLIG